MMLLGLSYQQHDDLSQELHCFCNVCGASAWVIYFVAVRRCSNLTIGYALLNVRFTTNRMCMWCSIALMICGTNKEQQYWVHSSYHAV